MTVIQLDNCLLRKWNVSDFEALADIEYDPIVKEFLGIPKRLREVFVSSTVDDLRGWAIEAKPEGILAGRAAIIKPRDIDYPIGTGELEIVIAKQFWQRGIGRQVSKRLIDDFFSDPRGLMVIAIVHPKNEAIHKLLNSLSFGQDNTYSNHDHLVFVLNRLSY
jgi:RimJ/RimL family protein N-acetyltransferase